MLLFIIIHYIYYIINAVAGDLRNNYNNHITKTVLQKQRQSCNAPTTITTTAAASAAVAVADSEFKTTQKQLRTNGSKAKIKTTTTSKVMQTNDDAKYIKK